MPLAVIIIECAPISIDLMIYDFADVPVDHCAILLNLFIILLTKISLVYFKHV